MAKQEEAMRKQILFHLEAASAWAEEIGDTRTQEAIDWIRRDLKGADRDRSQGSAA